MKALVMVDVFEGEVRLGSREAINAARTIADSVTAAAAVSDGTSTDVVGSIGLNRAIVLTSSSPASPDTVGRELIQLINDEQPDVVVSAHSVDAMGYAPFVAASLGLGFAGDVHGLRSEGENLVVTRSVYGGKVTAEVELTTPAVITVRPGVWGAAEPSPATQIEARPVSVETRVTHERFVPPDLGDVDIASAEFILAVGRGLGEAENLEQFEELAQKLGATLAVSRPVVDAGWAPSSRQVGQSGQTVTPKVYLAFGISGAVQHVAGMKASGTVISVNSDPEAAIFEVSDFGVVADMFDIAEELDAIV